MGSLGDDEDYGYEMDIYSLDSYYNYYVFDGEEFFDDIEGGEWYNNYYVYYYCIYITATSSWTSTSFDFYCTNIGYIGCNTYSYIYSYYYYEGNGTNVDIYNDYDKIDGDYGYGREWIILLSLVIYYILIWVRLDYVGERGRND